MVVTERQWRRLESECIIHVNVSFLGNSSRLKFSCTAPAPAFRRRTHLSPSLGPTRPLKPLRPWRTPWTDTEAGTGHRIMGESRRPEAGWDYGQIQEA